MFRSRLMQVVSQCAELGVFFAAAAALGRESSSSAK